MQAYHSSHSDSSVEEIDYHQSSTSKFGNHPKTPLSKLRQEFKSPAPSNKKALHSTKSPLLTTQAKIANMQAQGVASAEKWAVSPVCSRLRDHIIMLNGNSNKERLFLQSPMTN